MQKERTTYYTLAQEEFINVCVCVCVKSCALTTLQNMTSNIKNENGPFISWQNFSTSHFNNSQMLKLHKILIQTSKLIFNKIEKLIFAVPGSKLLQLSITSTINITLSTSALPITPFQSHSTRDLYAIVDMNKMLLMYYKYCVTLHTG